MLLGILCSFRGTLRLRDDGEFTLYRAHAKQRGPPFVLLEAYRAANPRITAILKKRIGMESDFSCVIYAPLVLARVLSLRFGRVPSAKAGANTPALKWTK